MHLIRTLAAAALLLLAAAAQANADSIAYLKDNNIWLAAPDGSHQVQITRDGTATVPYRSPSQADDGTLVAAHAGDLVKLAQTGQVLAQFAPPTATDSTGQVIADVPQQVAISPDGRRIAYVYSEPSCPPAATCGVRQVMLYSYSDRTTPVATFGQQTNLTAPSWIDNNRVIAFGGHFHQVNVDSPGGGDDDATYWFDDAGNEDVGDGELSRAADRLALVRSYGPNTHIAIYHVGGGVGGSAPDPACYTGTDASLAGPSWSPNGTKLAFADAGGVEVMPLPQVVAGDCPGASSSHVIIAGASQPDWGPASIGSDAGTWTPPDAGPPSTGGTPSPPQAGSPAGAGPPSRAGSPPNAGPPAAQHPAASLQALIARRVSLAAAVRAGLVVRVHASTSGRVSAVARSGRRVLARASSTSNGRGVLRLRLHLDRAAVQWLRRTKRRQLTMAVKLQPLAGKAVTRTMTIRVIR